MGGGNATDWDGATRPPADVDEAVDEGDADEGITMPVICLILRVMSSNEGRYVEQQPTAMKAAIICRTMKSNE